MKRTGEFGKLPAHLRRSAVLDAATRQFATSGRAGTSIDDIAAGSGPRSGWPRSERTGPAELTGVRVVAAGRYRSYCH
jgi:hypothetical protein